MLRSPWFNMEEAWVTKNQSILKKVFCILRGEKHLFCIGVKK